MKIHYLIENLFDGEYSVRFFTTVEKLRKFKDAASAGYDPCEAWGGEGSLDLVIKDVRIVDPDEGTEYWTKYPEQRRLDPEITKQKNREVTHGTI